MKRKYLFQNYLNQSHKPTPEVKCRFRCYILSKVFVKWCLLNFVSVFSKICRVIVLLLCWSVYILISITNYFEIGIRNLFMINLSFIWLTTIFSILCVDINNCVIYLDRMWSRFHFTFLIIGVNIIFLKLVENEYTLKLTL